jgi:hypothetical protein
MQINVISTSFTDEGLQRLMSLFYHQTAMELAPMELAISHEAVVQCGYECEMLKASTNQVI